jgi:hypothetical protein
MCNNMPLETKTPALASAGVAFDKPDEHYSTRLSAPASAVRFCIVTTRPPAGGA